MSLSAAVGSGSLEPELAEIRSLLLDADALIRAVASGRRRNATVRYRRVELRYVEVRGERVLQTTAYDDTQAHARNADLGAASASVIDELLGEPFSSWHVETRSNLVQLRVTKRGRMLLHRQPRDEREPAHAHDRVKQRRLSESDDLFAVLGLATPDGRIKPSRRAKYRQVEDFLAAVDAVVTEPLLQRLGVSSAGANGRPLRIVDLGCGNAYLTFAALRYLTAERGLRARAVGVDVRADARRRNEDIAAQLGVASDVTFLDSSITDAPLDEAPDVVLALHACDTATDDALARAVRWQAPVVLAAPCCHHDLQRQLGAARSTPEPYELVTRSPILRERFADVMTDALRAAILRITGYRAEVVEFVDAEHTPRNALIRAVRTDAAPSPTYLRSYRQLVAQWNLRPALAERLAPDYPVLTHSPEVSAPGGAISTAL